VRGADRPGDRQPEADAAVTPALDPPERLEQRGHGVGGYPGPAVGDPQDDARPARARRDPDPAARLVVPDRVVDQVPDHALDELLITGRLGRRELCLHLEPQPGDAGRGEVERVLGHRRKVQQLVAGHTLIADREDQERLDHVLGPVDGTTDACRHVLQLLRGPGRLGQRDVDGGPHDGQRGAELVRGVRDEPALRGEREVQPFQHLIEGIRQFLELVPGAGQGQPFPQVLVRGPAGGLGDRPHRPQHPAGDEPAQAARNDRHRPQADQGEEQQAVQGPLAHAGRGGPGPGAKGPFALRHRAGIGTWLLAGDGQLGQLIAAEPGGVGGRGLRGQVGRDQAVGEPEQRRARD